jgi:hypothetical protein
LQDEGALVWNPDDWELKEFPCPLLRNEYLIKDILGQKMVFSTPDMDADQVTFCCTSKYI